MNRDNTTKLIETHASQRVLNCLHREGYRTIQDLHGVTAVELLTVPNFGKTALEDLRIHLAPYGVIIHDDENPLTIRQVVDFLTAWMKGEELATLPDALGCTVEHAREAMNIVNEHGLLEVAA